MMLMEIYFLILTHQSMMIRAIKLWWKQFKKISMILLIQIKFLSDYTQPKNGIMINKEILIKEE